MRIGTRGLSVFRFPVRWFGLVCLLVVVAQPTASGQFFPLFDVPQQPRFQPHALTGPLPWMQWKMSEGSGTTLHDIGVSGNNFTIGGNTGAGTNWIAAGGKNGQACVDFGDTVINSPLFTGAASQIVPQAGMTNLTFTGWINFRQHSITVNSQYPAWSQWSSNGTGGGELFILDWNVSSTFWDVGTSTGTSSFGGAHGVQTLSNTWYFFTFSWSTNNATPPAGDRVEYTNAIALATNAGARIFNPTASTDPTNRMWINASQGAGNVQGWFYANDWRVYSNQLTPAQITTIAVAGPTP